MTRQALIIFARCPVPGTVKTRLVPTLSKEQAATLYAAFVEDSVTRFGALNASLRLYVDGYSGQIPVQWNEWVERIYPQTGEDLGSRMSRAFEETFADGYDRVLIVGTDMPTLPVEYLQGGYHALSEEHSIAIGPTEDGGYYTLGMSRWFPQLFSGMSWSHAEVFSETVKRARKETSTVSILPEWYDVDTPGSLQRLARDLTGLQKATRTRDVLKLLGLLGKDWIPPSP